MCQNFVFLFKLIPSALELPISSKFLSWSHLRLPIPEDVILQTVYFLGDFFPQHFHSFIEYMVFKHQMAPHSIVLAWRIPWTEDPGGYGPWGHKESDTAEAT